MLSRLLPLVLLLSACGPGLSASLTGPIGGAAVIQAHGPGLVQASVRATVATSLRFYWQERGQATVELPQYTGTVLLPLGRAARLQVEGLDDGGNVVPLSGQRFEGSGTWFELASTSNPNVALITPLDVGPYDPVVLTADADPGPGYQEIWGVVNVRVVEP